MKEDSRRNCIIYAPKPQRHSVFEEPKLLFPLKKVNSIEKKMSSEYQLFIEKGFPSPSRMKENFYEDTDTTGEEVFQSPTRQPIFNEIQMRELRKSDPSPIIPPTRSENTIFLDPLFQTIERISCKIE